MNIRSTHTFATMALSARAYHEIAGKLSAAGYAHAFTDVGDQGIALDMQGIAVVKEDAEPEPAPKPISRPDEPLTQFFRFNHLPEHLRAVSRPFCELALHIVDTLPRNPERTVALRKLLEGKDAAVRAAMKP